MTRWVATHVPPLEEAQQVQVVQAWRAWLGTGFSLPLPPSFYQLQIILPGTVTLGEITASQAALTQRIAAGLGGVTLDWQVWAPNAAFQGMFTPAGRNAVMTCLCSQEGKEALKVKHLQEGQRWVPAARILAGGEPLPPVLPWAAGIVLSSSGAIVPVYEHQVPTHEGEVAHG